MSLRVTAGQLAGMLGGRVEGDPATELSNIAGLAEAGPGDLTFFANPKYEPQLATTKASAVLIAAPHAALTGRVAQVIVASPDAALAALVQRFAPAPWKPAAGVHPTAIIEDGVRLGSGVTIGAYTVIGAGTVVGDGTVIHAQVVIGPQVRIGKDCLLWPQTVVREGCSLGDRVILHPGAVVGADGFGFVPVDGKHMKIPQVGIVELHDDVEIGANTTIDRARFGRTVVGAGTKVDNLVQIAHNVRIGRHCLLVSQSGVAGSSQLGEHVVIGGQAGIAGHISLGDRTRVAGQSGVGKSTPPDAAMLGSPAGDFRQTMAEYHAVRKLVKQKDEHRLLLERLAALERQVADLSAKR